MRCDQVGLEFESLVGAPVAVQHDRVVERRGGCERGALRRVLAELAGVGEEAVADVALADVDEALGAASDAV